MPPATAPTAPKTTGPLSELERLRQELAVTKQKLAEKSTPKLSLKVSEKGAVSVYGLGRFPVTLYREQWEALIAKSADITAFIAANAAKLKTKE